MRPLSKNLDVGSDGTGRGHQPAGHLGVATPVQMQPTGMEPAVGQALVAGGDAPTAQPPEGAQGAGGLGVGGWLWRPLPVVELVPHHLLTGAHHGTGATGQCPAVAQLEGPMAGGAGEDGRHGPWSVVRVVEGAQQQQHPTAFGVDGQATIMGQPQRPEAAAGLGKGGAVEFGIAPWQHQGCCPLRQGFIRQWRPGMGLRPVMLQPLPLLGIKETERLVLGNGQQGSGRTGWPGLMAGWGDLRGTGGQEGGGSRGATAGLQVGQETVQVKLALRHGRQLLTAGLEVVDLRWR